MGSWMRSYPNATQEMLRDFRAMYAAMNAYGRRYSEIVGDFGEGFGKPQTKHYQNTFWALMLQTEELARDLGKILRLIPEEWITEDDMDSATWTETVAQELRERDLMDEYQEGDR